MGLKHLEVAMEAGVICVLGSMGLFSDETCAEVAGRIGYPVMLKASAEGGGIGMVICEDEGALGAGGYKAR
jgi:biotin carboxylase